MPQNEQYILISLREEYYNEIMLGNKKYEYRKIYKKEPTKAFIYVSKTIKKIKAIIEFDTPIIDVKEKISQLAENECKGTYQAMMTYFTKDIGYAIPIKSIMEIEEVSLFDIKKNFPNFVPPQSYYSLNQKQDLLEFLKGRKILNKYIL